MPRLGAISRHELIEIDFEGIEDRVLAFPVPDGRYQQIAAIKGKVLYTLLPIEGSLSPQSWGEARRKISERAAG